ncbi:DUF4032 domain-containing protein [Arcanobacterium canis]
MPPKALQITSAKVVPALLDLPWNIPLEEWPEELIATLPRGISRHVVRFVNLEGEIIAIKEIGEEVAHHEYEMLRDLDRIDAPCVDALAVITGRYDDAGEPLNAVLITHHLPYSLPYRAIFSQQSSMRPETVNRLTDALTVLMVRLHLIGFFWGDVSLSNTLFRRDAGEYAAYLVDAETGELEANLSPRKRAYDIDVARTNIIGELMDLQAGGILDEEFDAIAVGNRFEERYHALWAELTAAESFSLSDRWRVDERINRLNQLGFDVGEMSMSTDIGGTQLSIQPMVVDAGHYSRQIMRLTGMDVEEQQARRMMNDLDSYRTLTGRDSLPLSVVAHQWMTEVFEPTVNAIPRELAGKLQRAEIFHEVLEHRWYMSEKAGHDVPMKDVIESYINDVLVHRPDEQALIPQTETTTIPLIME